ncbi:MAG: response regulator transcription factor [Candidatus Thiodiazotropha sp.]|jgi:DNA-binding response OmpR family regulator
MNHKPRILIIEDEVAIRVGLIDVFVYHGFEVDSAAEGPEGLEKSLTGTFDMILLDVMLPGMNGFEICNQIRERSKDQPIIMLTAKTSDEDIIHGLRLGADDYVAKPFSVAQLVLRVQAVLRRSKISEANQDTINLADRVEVNISNLSGKRDDELISFTRREMEILEYLYAHKERPVPRDELLNKVWGYAKNIDIETRTVDIHVAKLRRKIEPNSAEPRFLTTVRGAGYRLLVD